MGRVGKSLKHDSWRLHLTGDWQNCASKATLEDGL